MKRSAAALLFLLVAVCSAASAAPAHAAGPLAKVLVRDARSGRLLEAAAGEVLVGFKPDVPEGERGRAFERHRLLDRLPARVGGPASDHGRALLARGADLDAALAALRADPAVAWAEPNWVAKALGAAPAAGDGPESQWALDALGVPAAWEVSAGDPAVRVAVIDTGVDAAHPDLAANLDAGWDFVDGDATPEDRNGHGTFCAGLIAAVRGNGIGTAGVAPRCRVIPLKALGDAGEGTYADVIDAIDWAAARGARVISMSFGGPAWSQALQDAVDRAAATAVLVAAAGNAGSAEPAYPAALTGVIAVAAIVRDRARLADSNSGAHVAVAAPGEDVRGPAPGGGYAVHGQTSAAAALVAGGAALVVSRQPEWPAPLVARTIARQAVPLGEGHPNPLYGYGLPDFGATLRHLDVDEHDLAVRSLHPSTEPVAPGSPLPVDVTVQNAGTHAEAGGVELTLAADGVACGRASTPPLAVAGRAVLSVLCTGAPPRGEFTLAARLAAAPGETDLGNNTASRVVGGREAGGGTLFSALYGPDAHEWIALQALEIWSKPEMLAPALKDLMTLYSWEEDNPYTNCLHHFWNADNGGLADPSDGYRVWDSAYHRAARLYQEALSLYRTDIFGTYERLGRVVHLLSDMASTAHVHIDDHIPYVGGEDALEAFMDAEGHFLPGVGEPLGDNCRHWTGAGLAPVRHPSLLLQFYNLNQRTDWFPSNDLNGDALDEHGVFHREWAVGPPYSHHDVEDDNGDPIMPVVIDIAGRVYPRAMEYVAGLYQMFWDDLHSSITVDLDGGALPAPTGAAWRLIYPGGEWTAWQASGATLADLYNDTYRLEFAEVFGWLAPAAADLPLHKVTRHVGASYVQIPHGLTVTIEPLGARADGARWRVSLPGGAWSAWYESGATAYPVNEGAHTVEFADIAATGWTRPASKSVLLLPGQPASTSGAYTEHTGSLRVTLTGPAEARWRVDDRGWRAGGETETGLHVGTSHWVFFQDVAGWSHPAPYQDVPVARNLTTTRSATYTQEYGSLAVNLDATRNGSPCALPATAGWRVDGGAWLAGGALVSSLQVGSHLVEFKPVADWTAPAPRSISIANLESRVEAGTYTQVSGSLVVMIDPAQIAGAQWRLDGGAWRDEGYANELTGLTVADHLLEFKPVALWQTAPPQTLHIGNGLRTVATGLYVPLTASLRVLVGPAEARAAGALWRVDGGDWHADGDTVAGLAAPLPHTVSYQPVGGWSKPADQAVAFAAAGETLTKVGTYTLLPGYDDVMALIDPPEAVADGARWQVDGDGVWRATRGVAWVSTTASHSIVFKDLAGWNTPAPIPFFGANQAFGAAYTRQEGSLRVTLSPDAVREHGGRWMVDGGAWLESGETRAGLGPGTHVVAFGDAVGWLAPAPQTVTVSNGATAAASAAYTLVPGTGGVRVALGPSGARLAGAAFSVDGGATWLASDATAVNLPAGTHTATFRDVPGWAKPADVTLSVPSRQIVTLSRTYGLAAGSGSLTVTLTPGFAVDEGALWSVVGTDEWHASGDTVGGLAAGDLTVTFKDTHAHGWDPPADRVASIAAGRNTAVTAGYSLFMSAIRIFLEPPEAVADGAAWKPYGSTTEPFRGSGYIQYFVNAVAAGGNFVPEYQILPGWEVPEYRVEKVVDGQMTTVTRSYTLAPGTGALRVNIGPAAAAASGARWSVDGGATWRESGSLLIGLPAGSTQTLLFSALEGWTAPPARVVTVPARAIGAAAGAYVRDTGSLRVAIEPRGAVAARARWRVDGGAWRIPGSTALGLPTGGHRVEFKAIRGWAAPPAQQAVVVKGAVAAAAGAYGRGGVYCVGSSAALHSALAAAAADGVDSEIQVVGGTYGGGFSFASDTVEGLALRGGYAPKCLSRADLPALTRLDGGESARALAISAGGPVELSNLTIAGGRAGAGLDGGGLSLDCGAKGAATLDRVALTGNRAGGHGGGAWIRAGTVAVRGCAVSANTSDDRGGGLALEGGGVSVDASTFLGNEARREGGGLSLASDAPALLTNNLLADNRGGSGGGAFVGAAGVSRVVGNTVARNTAGKGGGGLFLQLVNDADRVEVFNTIAWGNRADLGGDIYVDNDGDRDDQPSEALLQANDFDLDSGFAATLKAELLAPDLLAAWNIGADPGFADADAGDFRLTPGSPCESAGHRELKYAAAYARDRDGNPRPAGDGAEIGAFERPAFTEDFALGAAAWTPISGSWAVSAGEYVSNPAKNGLAVVAADPPGEFPVGRVSARLKLSTRFARYPNGAVVFGRGAGGAYRYVQLRTDRVVIGQSGATPLVVPGVKAVKRRRFGTRNWHTLIVDVDADGLVSVRVDADVEPAVSYRFPDTLAGRPGLWAYRAKTNFDDVAVWAVR